MRKTITIVKCAARAWHAALKHRRYVSNDKYQNPEMGHYIDTAFVAWFLGAFVGELVKES